MSAPSIHIDGGALRRVVAFQAGSADSTPINVSFQRLSASRGRSVVSAGPAHQQCAAAVEMDVPTKHQPSPVQIHGSDAADWLAGQPYGDGGIQCCLVRSNGRWLLKTTIAIGGGSEELSAFPVRVRLQRERVRMGALGAAFDRDYDDAAPEKRIAVTGTREGLPEKRMDLLRGLLRRESTGSDVILHHGDCLGVDAAAHGIAVNLGLRISIHPPDDPKLRAHRNHWRAVWSDPRPYLERNRDMVDAADLLVAMPRDPGTEEKRSGTWATVRYARKSGTPTTIL